MILSGCSFGDGGESSVSDYDAPESVSAGAENAGETDGGSDMYDVSPIVEAYRSGDTSALSQLDKDIYDKACEILGEIITEGMDDYEKELAVHDYIIYNCTYDEGALSAIPNPSENSDNPYGALINGQAICKGYTTTFRMFMGMLGIPCGTVHSSDTDGDEHAWNTVKLGGSWYYVDCTWDDPVPDYAGRLVAHTYFNVSREEISEQHVLPEGTPETDSIENSFYSRSAVTINNFEEIYSLAEAAVGRNTDSIVVIFGESCGVDLDSVNANDYGYFEIENAELQNVLDGLSENVGNGGERIGLADYRRVDTSQGAALLIEFARY